MGESKDKSFEENLAQLERDGFLLIKNALDIETVQKWRIVCISGTSGENTTAETVSANVSYNQLLEQEPDMTRVLIAHPSVAPYLKATLGKQCQLRSVRAHLNPDDYTQEWHMDFYDYWYQAEKVDASRFIQGFCMNTTFYLTDNTPERARLTFVKDLCHRAIPEELRAHLWYRDDRNNPFQRWCDEQPHADLYPMSGDAVVFYSHIPHQGAKIGPDPDGEIRGNIVFHYQQNPMYPGIRFVSHPQFTLDASVMMALFPSQRIKRI